MKLTSETANNMLSRYTWWDFFIVGGIITLIYYAYIAIAYYREDIREWWSNLGSKNAEVATNTAQPTDEADEEEPALYSVHSYGSNEQKETPPIPSTAPAPAVAATQMPTPTPVAKELDLDGAVITEEAQSGFDLPINGAVHRETEEPLSDVLDAAERVSKDENGLAKANDEQDKPAARIASMINYQAGQAAFADIFSNR